MKTVVILAGILVIVGSCHNLVGSKGKIVSSEKMEAVLWDILQSEAYTDYYLKKDSTRKDISLQNAILQKKVFELHEISKEDFYKSYDYYSNHNNDMRTILDSITNKAERQRSIMMQKRYTQKISVTP